MVGRKSVEGEMTEKFDRRKFIGGSDIMTEMYESGELSKVLGT